ncbi:MAG TPA: 1-acyl-sn-glycerol-3-phosphate acyltransferase [Salinivirga sp.]|uniref:1-acyl-sn-glycerol-3-phosphate acyltransferase n=1 Tax=Salinivirga sp. TaxID=1970192 RepID=UPI002B49476E|nr:1-acyl-sn-glycerol-3-phosphate acyltransferase [Salinivirga sp.]HKK60097.1 1-acyl-sn-glycerol-3-phosphate acyltransferase [Salinivirga sp.]
MGKKKIEKYTFPYWITYQIAKAIHNLIYREFYVINRPQKKQEKPSIITPNHQNALMDAMAVLFAKKEPLVFLARSDIFKQKAVASILYFLKILPIYRIRDGFDNLKNNQETFDHTVRVLSNKRGLVILPEGNHYGAKRLRPLKKGFGRIAFMTEINGDEQVDLQIVPTAIDYTAYDTFFSRLTVVFGEPFPLKPYMEEYKNNSQKALNSITQHLRKSLQEHIIHIESEKYYDACLLASAVYAENKHSGNNAEAQKVRFYSQRDAAKVLNKAVAEDSNEFKQMVESAEVLDQKAHGLPHEILAKKPSAMSFAGALLSFLLVPLAIPGTIIYGALWYWPIVFVNKKIKDVQFRTSFRYVLYIVQFFLLLLGIFIYLFSAHPPKTALIVFIMTILSGVLSLKIWRLVYWYYLKAKWFIKSLKKPELLRARNIVIEKVESLIGKG